MEDYYDIVLDIARQEVVLMSQEDKEYYLHHPDYEEHRFSYGMYLKNNYIYGQVSDVDADRMSEEIFETIIELLRKQSKY